MPVLENVRHIQQRVIDELFDTSQEDEQMPINLHLTSVEASSRVLHKIIDSRSYPEDLLQRFLLCMRIKSIFFPPDRCLMHFIGFTGFQGICSDFTLRLLSRLWTLTVANLYYGIDWYFLGSNHFMDASFQHTTTHPTSENVILPITFVYSDNAVLSRMSCRCARITDANTWCLIGKLTDEHRRFGAS